VLSRRAARSITTVLSSVAARSFQSVLFQRGLFFISSPGNVTVRPKKRAGQPPDPPPGIAVYRPTTVSPADRSFPPPRLAGEHHDDQHDDEHAVEPERGVAAHPATRRTRRTSSAPSMVPRQ
jgi:hypothetical protein